MPCQTVTVSGPQPTDGTDDGTTNGTDGTNGGTGGTNGGTGGDGDTGEQDTEGRGLLTTRNVVIGIGLLGGAIAALGKDGGS